jgi:molybdate transport system substrate-binding protein
MSARLLLASALVLVAGCKDKSANPGARQGDPLRVAAAADLALAFKDVGAAWEKETGKKVDFSFGSTGLLAKQIEEGAPFDVYAAANVSFVDEVIKNGACSADSKSLYARGRIVIWSKDPQKLPKTIEELKDPKYSKIAIANPEHAPYGLAAQQAMTKAGVWDSVKPRAVFGENVQQTLMFARSENADVAFVALSLAVSSPGNWIPVDPALHEPLDQALVACNGGKANTPKTNEAKELIAFIGSPEGRSIMKKYGFLLPGEELPPAH